MTKPVNKIEKLIAELCPDGVEFRELGEVCKVLRGNRLTKKELSDDGDYPVFHGGLIPLGRYDKFNRKANQTMVINTGSVGEVVWSGVDFWSSDGTFVVETSDNIDDKYLYYFLKTQEPYLKTQKREGGVPTIDRQAVEKILIPVPPLPIQQEIVKILDNFTKLEAELEAEIEARKKQYEYYRNELLTFDRQTVRWLTLNEIGKVSMCKRIFKNETLASGDIPFYKIGTFGKQPNAYISREVYDEYRKKFSFPKKGDVLLSVSGTIGRRVIYNGEPAYFQDSNIIWIDNDESKVSNKFLYYLYAIIEWKTEGGTIQRLYNDNLKKIKIPVPPLAEQERIVAILDKFDALVNDISVGLPAELNARRKQYEYYRDELLTFEEYARQ
jgi:type I restriction enzyme S subunit